MKNSKKKYLSLIIIVVLLAAAYFGYSKWFSPPEAPIYVTQSVKQGDIEQSVLANGMLQASKLVSVGAQASGQIQTLPAVLGQRVSKGDVIATIDNLSQQNALKEAESSLASLNAQLRANSAQIKQSQLAFNRQKAMLADHASSQADYETAESDLRVYQANKDELLAEIDQAKISVDSAKLDLSYTTITAPMDGVVVYVAVEVGQTVNASQTTPTIVEIADLDTMKVKAQISEADVIHVTAGQPVYFTILGDSDNKIEGTLASIEPGPTTMDGDDNDMTSDDSTAVYYNGIFNVANPNHKLRIGMTAEVSIVLNQAKNALLVPAQVLTDKQGNQATVPILVNGQIQYKRVETGLNNRVNVEIKSGLSVNDNVVLGAPSQTSSTRMGRPPMGF